MRLHSSKITYFDVSEAVRRASTIGDGTVFIEVFSEHGSRKRAKSFEVRLSGDGSFSKRRTNPGKTSPVWGMNPYAATWCAWGVFLAHLFEVDPEMLAGEYQGVEDFNLKTKGMFAEGKRPRGHRPQDFYSLQAVS
jgi:hypothetical protein